MIKKIAYTLFLTWPTALLANEPKDWQLGFQKSASKSMDDIVWFHDYMLVPIITAITAFVLFLLLYVCVRYRASKNQVPSTTSHNTLIEVIWTLVPCLILIVMAVPSFKVLYSQDEIPKADVTIKAIGYQWYWGYEYPDENIIFDSYMIDEKDLKENIKIIKKFKNQENKKIKIIYLPMPKPKFIKGIRVPASYLNFYIANKIVLVPVFNDLNDKAVLKIFKKHFKNRKIIPIDCSVLVWGFGTIHCLTQQQPR